MSLRTSRSLSLIICASASSSFFWSSSMNRAIVRDDASRQKTLSTSASIQEAEQGTNSKAAPDENGDDHSAVPDGGEKQRDEEGGGLELSGGDENQTSTGNALLEAKESKRTAEANPNATTDEDEDTKGIDVNDEQLAKDDKEEEEEEGDDTKADKNTKVMDAGVKGNKVVIESEAKEDQSTVLFQKSFGVVQVVAEKLNDLSDASATIGEEIGEHKDRIDRRKKRFKRLVKRLNKDLASIREGMGLIKSGAETIESLGEQGQSTTS